ncbi:MAG: glycosyltransferase family 2 protein, partial [Gammaproteobacteria bacterium]
MPTSSFEKRFERIFGVLARLDSAELEKLPGIEWLLDNDYVVQEAISAVTEGTPDDGYRRLPMLATAPRRGELRVLALADEIMNICGTPMELSWVERFLSAYQTDAELSLGELWALPNMLRSVALERLANATQSLVSAASDEAVAVPDYSEAIASYVINLRNLATQDWTAFVEAVSQVHEILVHDPVGAYAQMDTATRNRYRHRVEVIARRTGCLESAVARQAVALGEDLQADAPERHRHVGFYLIDGGLVTLVESLKHGRRWIFALSAWLERHTGWWYLGSIVTVTASITWWVARFLPPGAMSYVLLLPITLVLSLTAGVSFVHWLVGLWHKPQALPKLDFKAGLPVAHATAVVTPAMLSSRSEIEHLLECAEKNYLGNSDPALRYALLTDFIDADTMHDEADDALLSFAVQTVESLNARHGTDLLRPFFLFHRQREWSEREGCYMGRERKRGKLAEFNSLLLGNRAAESALVVGDADHLRGIRFVITLDADTQLPPGSANALVGVLAHPLNQPVLEGPCVTAGYSVIQPRLSVDPEIANSNPFTRAFAGDVVLDLYSHAVSDVYQDLFEVGIFVGKGIYDVRAFEQTLEGRVPDNAILSHDLFEGLHGRVGLATDITLFEDYPVDLLTFARRAHRWIRGDWQLLPWLAPFVPAQRGFVRNRFTLLDRWKLFDNLRQSLLAPATLLALVAGWTLLPGISWVWTLGILTLSAAPIAFGSVHALGSGIAQGGTPRAMVEHLALAMPREGARWLFSLAYLPYETFMNLDAIGRTLWRLTVSRRHLLQWQPAALAMRDVSERLSGSYVWRRMLAAPLTALAVGGGVAWVQPTALWVAGPFLALWFVAPQIAIASTKRRAHAATDEHAATSAQKRLLRKVALRTWGFFEHFVGPDTHWLPPDNYHEAPETFVSKRTSPTNIGLMLLA